MVPEAWDEVRCDLRRIPYDIESDEWGEPETVLSAEETAMLTGGPVGDASGGQP